MVKFLKRMMILSLINLVIVLLIYLIKSSLTIYNLGHGIYIGGIAMILLAGLCLLGAANSVKANAWTHYVMSANGNRKGYDYISERNKNMNFSLLLFLTGIVSIAAGYFLSLL